MSHFLFDETHFYFDKFDICIGNKKHLEIKKKTFKISYGNTFFSNPGQERIENIFQLFFFSSSSKKCLIRSCTSTS